MRCYAAQKTTERRIWRNSCALCEAGCFARASTNIAGIVLNLAGAVRPKDGNGDMTATLDMGAYEVPAIYPGSTFRVR